jgi:hypothetical protein
MDVGAKLTVDRRERDGDGSPAIDLPLEHDPIPRNRIMLLFL